MKVTNYNIIIYIITRNLPLVSLNFFVYHFYRYPYCISVRIAITVVTTFVIYMFCLHCCH